MSNPENETHKIVWDFEIQTDHLISARRPDLMIVKNKKNKKQKKNCQIVDFAVPANHWVKLKEGEKRNKRQKTMGHESDGDTDRKWCARYSHQMIGTRTEELGNTRMSGDHPNYSIVEIGQNTKSRGDLRRLAIAQTPVENHQLTLV